MTSARFVATSSISNQPVARSIIVKGFDFDAAFIGKFVLAEFVRPDKVDTECVPRNELTVFDGEFAKFIWKVFGTLTDVTPFDGVDNCIAHTFPVVVLSDCHFSSGLPRMTEDFVILPFDCSLLQGQGDNN